MAMVTRQFRDDFETWAADRITRGEWTENEVEGLRGMLRKDFAPGPDQLRAGGSVILAAGLEVPAAIDDHEERYCLWVDYFATEAQSIRLIAPCGTTNFANLGDHHDRPE